MKKWISIVLVVLLLAAGALLAGKRKKSVTGAPVAIPVTYTVRTVLPETKTISQTSTFLAKLEPVTQAVVSTKLSGQIKAMLVRETQTVQQGDGLLQIDDQEIQAGIAALQANLSSAREQSRYSKDLHERNQAMFEAGGLPQEKLDASAVAHSATMAAIEGLEQQIKALENQLGYCHITAPFPGIVGTIFLQQGNLATPGRPILSLHSLPQKLTFSFVPESTEIQSGQEVLLQGTKIGTITKLYADAKAGLWVAEVVLDSRHDQPSGSYLTIQVVTKTLSGCAVPTQSLLHRKQGTSLMLYQDNHFEEKAVSVMAQNSEFALVEPSVTLPIAVAAEAKLSLLPSAQGINVITGEVHE